MFWSYTKPWTSERIDIENDPVKFDLVQGMLLMIFMMLLDQLLEIPLNLFSTFMIADSHGFNNQKLGGFFKDILLSQMLNLILSPLIYWALLSIIYKTGDNFFIYAGLFITFFVLIMVVLAPLVIMPLFNKFDPIEENLLKQDIQALAGDCKYPVSNIEVVDGSKRSGHSNAF